MKAGRQTTLGAGATVSGIGVHSGRPASLTFHPAEADTGIVFANPSSTQAPGAISIWRDGDNWSVSLALAIAQSTPDGQVVKSVVGDVDVGVPAARYEQIMTKGFSFTRIVALLPTATRVQVVLRDPANAIVAAFWQSAQLEHANE